MQAFDVSHISHTIHRDADRIQAFGCLAGKNEHCEAESLCLQAEAQEEEDILRLWGQCLMSAVLDC